MDRDGEIRDILSIYTLRMMKTGSAICRNNGNKKRARVEVCQQQISNKYIWKTLLVGLGHGPRMLKIFMHADNRYVYI